MYLQTLGWRQSLSNIPGDLPAAHHENPARIFPTKAIRIVSLAPNLSRRPSPSSSASNTREQSAATDDDFFDPENPLGDEAWRSQAALLELVSMLQDDFDDVDADPDEAIVADIQGEVPTEDDTDGHDTEDHHD